MIPPERIGIFVPSIGPCGVDECLEFCRSTSLLVQGWTLSSQLAHEEKQGLPFEKLKEEAAAGRLKVSSLSGYMDWTEKTKNEMRKEEFKKIIVQCKECGSGIICTETGRDFVDREDARAWKLLVDSMIELCEFATANGVTIAIEMGRADLIFGVDRFRTLKKRVKSDALKVNFDPANLYRGNVDPLTALKELLEDVVQVHLKDANAQGMTALTKGEVDFAGLFRVLDENGYAGNYIIEQEYERHRMRDAVAADYKSILRVLET